MLENGNGYHYVLIKNLNGLLGKGESGTHPKELCPYCCLGFDKRYREPGELVQHMERCFQFKGTKVIMPEKDQNKIMFTNYSQ